MLVRVIRGVAQMTDESQTISVSQAERAAAFQGGRALCLILAAVIVTAEIMLGSELPDRSHGLMFVSIILLVGYAMLSWHGDRALIRVREVLAETHLVREQGEERAAEMRKIETRVTKIVEATLARLAELENTASMHGQGMATMHDDLDKLIKQVAEVASGGSIGKRVAADMGAVRADLQVFRRDLDELSEEMGRSKVARLRPRSGESSN